jgi:hypothetical protein
MHYLYLEILLPYPCLIFRPRDWIPRDFKYGSYQTKKNEIVKQKGGIKDTTRQADTFEFLCKKRQEKVR